MFVDGCDCVSTDRKNNNNNNTNTTYSQNKAPAVLCFSWLMGNGNQCTPENQCSHFCFLLVEGFFLFLFNKNVNKAGLMIVLSTVESNAALGKGSGWVLPFAATQVVGSSFCWDLFGCGACPMTACVWGERATESLPEEKKDSVSDLHDPSFYSSSSSFQCSISNNRKVNGHSMKNMVEDSSRNGDAFK